jgi:hypothetical protein
LFRDLGFGFRIYVLKPRLVGGVLYLQWKNLPFVLNLNGMINEGVVCVKKNFKQKNFKNLVFRKEEVGLPISLGRID